jgi:hypothetical protein
MLLAIGETTGKIVFNTLLTKAVHNFLESKNKKKKEEKNYLINYKVKLLIKLYEKITQLEKTNLYETSNIIKSISNKVVMVSDDKKFNQTLENYNYLLNEIETNNDEIDLEVINNEMKQIIKETIKRVQ